MSSSAIDGIAPFRGMRRVLAALVAALIAAPLAWLAVAPSASADEAITVDKVTVTSAKAEAWTMVGIAAEWHATSPAAGQSFTVSLGKGLRWPAGLNFPLLNQEDTAVTVGECIVPNGSEVMTCTFNDAVEQWSKVTGSLQATAQITDALIGASSSTVVVADVTANVIPGDSDGDGACDVDCGPVVPQPVSKTIFKAGWLSAVNADGTFTWAWDINVHGSTEYTISDPGVTLRYVECTDSTWANRTLVTPTTNEDGSWTWSVDSTDTVCRARLSSSGSQDTASNAAVVNGTSFSATAQAKAVGSGSLIGEPQTTPEPTPSTDAPAPSDTPSAPESQSAAPSESASATVTIEVAPPSSATVSASATASTGSPLARTGAAGTAALVAVVLLAGAGAGLLIIRRRA